MPRGTNYIQVGDFGLGYHIKDYELHVLELIDKIMVGRHSDFYVIRGNHDNPDLWYDEDYNDFERVHLVKDNTLLEIDGKQVFFLGGAISIDRSHRKQGKDYWEKEVLTPDMDKIKGLDHVDIVVTHTAPIGVYPVVFGPIVYHYHSIERRKGNNLIAELDAERILMDLVRQELVSKGVKNWFYGHFHHYNNETIEGVNYVCLDIMQYFEHKVDN